MQQGAGRLTSSSYAILIDVNATEDGRVEGVHVKDSMLGDPGIEACMGRALQGMQVPRAVAAMRSSRRVSEGAVAPGSRQLVGNPGVLGGAVILLGPIVLVAAGVTVVVGVTIYILSESKSDADAERERCRKVNEECQRVCAPYMNQTNDYGGMPYHKCMRECREAAGCWRATKSD